MEVDYQYIHKIINIMKRSVSDFANGGLTQLEKEKIKSIIINICYDIIRELE